MFKQKRTQQPSGHFLIYYFALRQQMHNLSMQKNGSFVVSIVLMNASMHFDINLQSKPIFISSFSFAERMENRIKNGFL